MQGTVAMLLPTGLERRRVARESWVIPFQETEKPLVTQVDVSMVEGQMSHSQRHGFSSGSLSRNAAAPLGTQHYLRQ